MPRPLVLLPMPGMLSVTAYKREMLLYGIRWEDLAADIVIGKGAVTIAVQLVLFDVLYHLNSY